jgi:hypothetical protein
MNHLRRNGSTLNLPKTSSEDQFKCSEFRPCKRLHCVSCQHRRREYFITVGARICRAGNLSRIVVVAWKNPGAQYAFQVLSEQWQRLSKRTRGQMGKFIRVLALGEDANTPHCHVILGDAAAKLLLQKAKKLWPDIRVANDEVFDIENALGYIFDNNYLPTVLRVDRPKGLRILSGSRGMKYGYPKPKDWEAFQEILLNDVLPPKDADVGIGG